jgi:hypothetical protein
MQWYYIRDGERQGPVSDEEITRLVQDGTIRPTSLVWNETLGSGWIEAARAPGLLGARPPPLPPDATPSGPAPAPISCVAPLKPAWQGLLQLLFAPFRLSEWFALGFSAWLATLGKGAGSRFAGYLQPGNLNLPKDFGSPRASQEIHAFWRQHAGEAHSLLLWALGIAVATGLIVMWIRSRGQFMFLDNVVNRRKAVAGLWSRFRRHGNALFRWHVGYALVSIGVVSAVMALPVLSVLWPCVRAGHFVPRALPGVFLAVILFLLLVLAHRFIYRLMEDFVVPVMYRRRPSVLAAWEVLLPLLKRHFWQFVLYALFYLVLSAAVGLGLLLFALATCCLAGCAMLIPYVGAVVILPVTVFLRLYSLAFLAQFGEEYDVWKGKATAELTPVEDERQRDCGGPKG